MAHYWILFFLVLFCGVELVRYASPSQAPLILVSMLRMDCRRFFGGERLVSEVSASRLSQTCLRVLDMTASHVMHRPIFHLGHWRPRFCTERWSFAIKKNTEETWGTTFLSHKCIPRD